MPIIPKRVDFPVFPQANYRCLVQPPVLGTRKPFGAPESSKETVSCIDWLFKAGVEKSGKFTQEMFTDERGKMHPVEFKTQTSVDFGGEKSALRIIVSSIVGRPVSKDEGCRLDVELLGGEWVDVLVSVIIPQDGGDKRNKVEAISRAAAKPLDISKMLIDETPDGQLEADYAAGTDPLGDA